MEPLLNFKGMTSGGGNANVPGSAPFLPAQAFVNNITGLANTSLAFPGGTVTLTGITDFTFSSDPTNPTANKGDAIFSVVIIGGLGLDFTACPLTVTTVNAFLAFLVADMANLPAGVVNMTGMCAAATGQGRTDANTLNLNSWNVLIN